ncbi:hypothetical protein EVJ58_g1038 [Rhodofomes roseus]|uniref:Uncharacterized protein n=1 Tax=Rhodofomes roseus TaxID=34475 RepID=A0A4Y9Z3C5_9APHY|nr:hypothetical protein EVJ58_g1038 [Rhodofomes roseus]
MATASQTTYKPNDAFVASKLFSLDGFKAVVTGGGTGIGLMITQALVANGAKVYITGRRQDALDNVVQRISADITKRDDVLRLAKKVQELEPEGIQLLVNNAGVAKEKATTAYSKQGEPDMHDANAIAEHLLKATHESWAETFETNVTAQYFTAAAFIPLLSKGTANTHGYSASIVNVASISGMMRTSSSGQFAYAASKAAMLHLSKLLGTTLAQAKIRVNAICPGIFPSEMTADSSDEANKSRLQDAGKSLPAGRSGDDGDMAAAIVYLVGPNSNFLNGQVLHPDGGAVLTSPATA